MIVLTFVIVLTVYLLYLSSTMFRLLGPYVRLAYILNMSSFRNKDFMIIVIVVVIIITTYVFAETLVMITHNIHFRGEISKSIICISLLSTVMKIMVFSLNNTGKMMNIRV